ncbi:beta-glucosidase [Thermoanaerobacterium thermosaccharolyticum]|uniref:Beta-glucosidase n=1 Tax=Thermoanaerobacterium thermosaccharolyticum TaxID=1517 RepID=A0A223HXI8_THETR|nr:beta-N-acetylhexosaminidase [Thermoanaerobacterium thermosaccharolyticum]AST56995.1 beta-glucosidase [Thermoanaerobacterium thermosaccharolyticum]
MVDIRNMTLDEKIGQMLMVGFHSDEYDDHIDELVSKYKIGNIILFSRNVKEKYQLAKLNRDIQDNVMKNTKIPAFIAIDQEGGMVTRIYKDATYLPGNMAIAATNDIENAYLIGSIAGEELRALGININFAPVLDVNNNPYNPVIGVRSYGENSDVVARFGINYIKGLQEKGVIATAKHFPGHGDTSVDSHIDLPVVQHDKNRLYNVELYPFINAIKNGVGAIMTAHILFPAFEDEKLPATLSYNILTNLLRLELKFHGLIMTDCMEMNAIAKYFGTEKAAAIAVKAGADIVLISHTKELQIGAFSEIKRAIESGDISLDRIDESVTRILNMKEKYHLFQKSHPDQDKLENTVGCIEHVEIAKDVSRKSITLVKDELKQIPIRETNILSISPEPVVLSGIDDRLTERISFAKACSKRFGGADITIPVNPDDDVINNIMDLTTDKKLIIIGTYNANLNIGQCKLIKSIMKINKNIIVVALRNPYDVMMFRDVPTYICTFEYTPLSIESVLDALEGKYIPSGNLPVTLERM